MGMPHSWQVAGNVPGSSWLGTTHLLFWLCGFQNQLNFIWLDTVWQEGVGLEPVTDLPLMQACQQHQRSKVYLPNKRIVAGVP